MLLTQNMNKNTILKIFQVIKFLRILKCVTKQVCRFSRGDCNYTLFKIYKKNNCPKT